MTRVRALPESSASSSGFDLLFDAVPASPVWVGAGMLGLLLLLFAAIAWISGGLGELLASGEEIWAVRDARVGIWMAAAVAYLPCARRYATLSARRNLEVLRPLLDLGPSGPDTARRFGSLERSGLRIAGLLALPIVPTVALSVDRDPLLYFQEGYWRAETLWSWGLGAFAAWQVGGFVYATTTYSRRFSELAGRVREIDFFDLSPLEPFARQGLRLALLWLVLLSFSMVHIVDPGFHAVAAGMGVLTVAIATTALLLPVRGVHGRIREAKHAELRRIRDAIRGDLHALRGSAIAQRTEGIGLGDLLAYKAHLESVREWPFDSPTLVRFVLYLAIPFGGWVAGAIVERLLEAALG